MNTPFPGMDPYLEGHLWPDVHLGMSFLIKDQLAASVSADYVVRNATYTVEDTYPEEDIGIMYPDIEVLQRRDSGVKEPIAVEYAGQTAIGTPPTLSIHFAIPLEVRIPVVEIRDRKRNRLITAIELLSPVNKRNPGLAIYRKKRLRLQASGVHLLEIDLLRRGERPLRHPWLPKSHYMAFLTRAGSDNTQVWAFNLNDPLPVLPVPLKAPDPDVPLALRKVLEDIYTRSRYDLSINYQEDPPPPSLNEEERQWLTQLLGR